MKHNLKIVSLLLSMGLISASPTAGATETRSILVHSGDLSLASASGQETLRLRINNAVHEVCQVTGWGSTLMAERAQQACSSKALAAAMLQMDTLVQAAQSRHLAANQDVSVSRQ